MDKSFVLIVFSEQKSPQQNIKAFCFNDSDLSLFEYFFSQAVRTIIETKYQRSS